MKHPTRFLGAVAAVALAATVLLSGNSASAGGPAQDVVRAGAGTYTGSADQSEAPPTAVRSRAGTDRANCWTTIRQPGGAGTTIYVDYNNCGSSSVWITPNSQAVNGSGTFTYVGSCSPFRPGEIKTWTITPNYFPATPTHNYSVTNCL
ncbi:hypothetical protein [Virgisporangium aliadipatigenens]|nr:hypothetical protein [Virgisporangium aliadipatigenens]